MTNLALAETDERERTSKSPISSSVRNYTTLGILFWFFSALIAGWLGLFSQSGGPPTVFGLFILTPIIAFTALFLASTPFRAFTKSISLTVIVGAHVWRFVGIGFIIAFLLGKLPPGFGVPEGIGDIVAAAFALPLARALYLGKRSEDPSSLGTFLGSWTWSRHSLWAFCTRRARSVFCEPVYRQRS